MAKLQGIKDKIHELIPNGWIFKESDGTWTIVPEGFGEPKYDNFDSLLNANYDRITELLKELEGKN